MRSRSSHPNEYFAVDPRVPLPATWPTVGIVGRIGRGEFAGHWVYVDPYWEGAVGEGLPVGYALELPAGRLRDVDGRPLLDDGTYDSFRSAGQGGFIDMLTTALEVVWFTDPETIADVMATMRG